MFRADINLIMLVLLLERGKTSRKGGRADECVGLENRCGATHRGFESHPFHGLFIIDNDILVMFLGGI